jgi:hypothetical protein
MNESSYSVFQSATILARQMPRGAEDDNVLCTMRHVVGALFAVSRDRSGVGGGWSGRVDFRQAHSTYK